MASVNDNVFADTEDNLETFLLFWLDAEVNTTDDNKKTQKKLRQIINNLRTFDDLFQCQQYIESLSEQDRLIFIVSGKLGRQIVPQIHQLRQLSSIYVYCMDKQLNEEWARQFRKIKDVIVQSDDLITQIKLDQKSRVKIEEQISFNIYTIKENPDQATIGLNDHFVHSLLLMNALRRLKINSKDMQQFISLCKKEYVRNNNQLEMINEFANKYTSDKALCWYIRESFLYRMLNKAIRVQNINVLLLFRFIISDIYKQLKQHQCRSTICAYRGQIMWTEELQYLQRSKNGYISNNSFLLTSVNRDKVLDFLNSSTILDGQHQVLFIIDADPNIITTKPFADISRFSSFTDEAEILFMIGCIFHLIEIEEDGNISMIRLKLCGNDEHNLKHLNECMKKIHEDIDDDNEIDLQTFGDILRRMGKYDLAETMYRRLLKELPSNNPSLSDVYCALGMVAKDKGDYNSSLKSYQKSLEIKQRIHPPDLIAIGHLYGCIGEAHIFNENDNKALKCINTAIELFQKAHAEHHPHMAGFYNNIASIYKRQEKYAEALEFYIKALAIDNKYSSSDRSNAGKTHNNIGIIYCHLSQYDFAMEHYQESLSIKLKIFPLPQLSIAKTYENIGFVYQMKDNLQQTLIYYQKAATIYHHLLPSQHPDVIQIDNDIQNILRKLK